MIPATDNPWTFKSWIRNFVSVDLPIGDLAKDVMSDSDFPNDDCFSKIYSHLTVRHASLEALETFILVWNFYLVSR